MIMQWHRLDAAPASLFASVWATAPLHTVTVTDFLTDIGAIWGMRLGIIWANRQKSRHGTG